MGEREGNGADCPCRPPRATQGISPLAPQRPLVAGDGNHNAVGRPNVPGPGQPSAQTGDGPAPAQGHPRPKPVSANFPRQGLSLTYASQVSTQPWPCPWPPSVPAITGRRHPPRGFFHLEHGTCCYLKSLLSAPRTLGGSLGAPGWVAGGSWGALGPLLRKGCSSC